MRRKGILKTIAGLVLSCAMVVGNLPGTFMSAKATSASDFLDIGIYDAGVYSIHREDLSQDYTTPNGTAHYDHSTNTITLNNYSYEGNGTNGITYYGPDTLHIVVEGRLNNISCTAVGPVAGIESNRTIVFSGDGYLNVEGTAAGIFSYESISVEGSDTLDVTARSSAVGSAVLAHNSVSVSGGLLYARGYDTGIIARNLVISGGEMIAFGEQNYGVNVSNDLTISDCDSIWAVGPDGALHYDGSVTNNCFGTGWMEIDSNFDTVGVGEYITSGSVQNLSQYKYINLYTDDGSYIYEEEEQDPWASEMSDEIDHALKDIKSTKTQQTVKLEGDHALDINIMRTIAENPLLTVEYDVTYKGQTYHIVIDSTKFKLDEKIAYYGPAWLITYVYYGLDQSISAER